MAGVGDGGAGAGPSHNGICQQLPPCTNKSIAQCKFCNIHICRKHFDDWHGRNKFDCTSCKKHLCEDQWVSKDICFDCCVKEAEAKIAAVEAYLDAVPPQVLPPDTSVAVAVAAEGAQTME